MPEHIVVRCFSCKTHQAVAQNKKGKFACRLCGANQSVQHIIARGTPGKELRLIVQDLNYTKGKEAEAAEALRFQMEAAVEPLPLPAPEEPRPPVEGPGKWAQYVPAPPAVAPINQAGDEEGFATNFGAGWTLGRKRPADSAGQPGYHEYVAAVANLLRNVEAELRDLLAREVVRPVPGGAPAVAPQTVGGPGESASDSQAAADPPAQAARHLSAKWPPPPPPGHLQPAQDKGPLKPVKVEPSEGKESPKERGVKDVALTSPEGRARSSGRRRREADQDKPKGEASSPRDRRRSRSRRDRDRDRRRRRSSTPRTREEEGGKERKRKSEKPPEPEGPPPSREQRDWRPREPSYPPPSGEQGKGWKGELPTSSHPRKGALKRPAAKSEPKKKPSRRKPEEDESSKEPTAYKRFAEVDLRTLTQLGSVVLQDAKYYGRTCPVAGFFQGLVTEGHNTFAKLKVTGTKHEELLRVLSGRKDRLVQIHLCEEGCTEQLTDEVLLHGHGFEPVELSRVPWLTNLQGAHEPEEVEDEMAELRAIQDKLAKEAKEKDKKGDKKEKKRKSRGEGEEGRNPRSPKGETEELELGQKSLEAVFKNTGMDPDPIRRAKVLKKARKLGKSGKKKKKKKEKGTSSSSPSASSTPSESSEEDYGTEGLFEEEKRLRTIWKKCPGALSARSIQEIKRNLLTSSGTMWEINKSSLPPILTQYGRQVVMGGMSASLQQETLTICQSLDLLARGSVASCMDLLMQRLKSLEALGKGAHWSYCRQLELIRVEEGGITEDQEKLSAARRAREEERLKSLIARPPGSKGAEGSQGGKARKGKEKGASKGSTGDGDRGKGGQGGRDDPKGTWQKKPEK
eukprot:s1207_g11.t1